MLHVIHRIHKLIIHYTPRIRCLTRGSEASLTKSGIKGYVFKRLVHAVLNLLIIIILTHIHVHTSKNVMSGFPFDFLARASPNHWYIRFPGFQPYPVSKLGKRLRIPNDASAKCKQ